MGDRDANFPPDTMQGELLSEELAPFGKYDRLIMRMFLPPSLTLE